LHRIPICLSDGSGDESGRTAGLRIQGHPFLAKPISLSDLITGIEENLAVRAGANKQKT